MSHHCQMPVWKAAMDLAVQREHAVRRFPRCHKYTLDTELRHTTQQSLCRALVALWQPRVATATQPDLF